MFRSLRTCGLDGSGCLAIRGRGGGVNEYQVTIIQANGSWAATKVNASDRYLAILVAISEPTLNRDIASIVVEESESGSD
jgi:hypothetical protein